MPWRPSGRPNAGATAWRERFPRALGDDRLLLVASDRISTFDVILPTPIPDKGRVLTELVMMSGQRKLFQW